MSHEQVYVHVKLIMLADVEAKKELSDSIR